MYRHTISPDSFRLEEMGKTAPKGAVGCIIDPEPGWQNGNPCAGINRHEAENARVLRERGSDPLGPEFLRLGREVPGEA